LKFGQHVWIPKSKATVSRFKQVRLVYRAFSLKSWSSEGLYVSHSAPGGDAGNGMVASHPTKEFLLSISLAARLMAVANQVQNRHRENHIIE
jgi:hypothetical protein